MWGRSKKNNHHLRHFFMVMVCSLLSSALIGQETWSMDQFMLTSSSNTTIKYQNEILNLQATDNYRMPIIERLEFRTETHEFDLEQQEYALRLTTNSLKQINATQNVLNSEKELNKIHQEVLMKNELMNRYQILVSLVFLQDNLKLIHSELKLYEAKLQILKTMGHWDAINIKDLIATEEDFQKADIERISVENKLQSLKAKISEICSKDVEIDLGDLIAPRFIQDHYQEILGQDSIPNSEVEKLNVALEQLRFEQTAEENKNKKLVRYYQMNYDGRDKPFEQEHLSIGVGFLLPLGGSDRRKSTELQYDELELQSDYESALQSMKLDRYDVLVELKNNIKKHELLQRHFDESIAKKTLEKYNEIPEISALSVLTLKEFDLSQKRKLLASEFTLYKNYLKSIEVFDLVNPDQFQNYLSIRHFGY